MSDGAATSLPVIAKPVPVVLPVVATAVLVESRLAGVAAEVSVESLFVEDFFVAYGSLFDVSAFLSPSSTVAATASLLFVAGTAELGLTDICSADVVPSVSSLSLSSF